jgi:hypothetical protein
MPRLTLPIWPPLPKSWAPCRVMFSAGLPSTKNRVSHNCAVFCALVPHLIRFTLEATGVNPVVQASSRQTARPARARHDQRGIARRSPLIGGKGDPTAALWGGQRR